MKPLNNINNQNRKNSCKNLNIKRILKKSSKQTNRSLKKIDVYRIKGKKSYKDNHQRGNDELYFLSNANLNIINILNTCISEDFYNDTNFINKFKEKSKNNINRLKKTTWKTDKSRDLGPKKKCLKTNISSNRAQLGSDILNKEKPKFFTSMEFDSISNSIKSHLKRSYKEKEAMSEGKILKKSKKMNFNKYYSNIGTDSINLSLKTHNIKNDIIKKISHKTHRKYQNNAMPLSREKNTNFFGDLSNKEIIKLNENINNEVNYISLKKRITKLKKKIEAKYSNQKLNSQNSNSFEENSNKFNEKKKKIGNNYQSNSIKKNSLINDKNEIKNLDKFRHLSRKICLYDSIDDEEYNDEVIDYYIDPSSLYIRIFDILLFLCSMIYFIFIPYFLAKNLSFLRENKAIKLILMSIDGIYILEIINNFFRAYQTYDEHLIRRTRKIFIHYIKTWFFIDLLQAIPFYSIFNYLEENLKENYGYHQLNPILYILLMIKVLKIYKMLNDNSSISFIVDILTKNETIDNYGSLIVTILFILFILNLSTCLFIFLGFNSYPNWLLKLDIQDESFLNIYLVSVYFIIVTITTVGYGDITGDSIPEFEFQIFLLIIGTIAYSFTISYISNYIIKIHKKSITFEKNLEILREIRVNHPNMKKSIYQEVLKTLHNEQLFEKKDKHLLFDCLPYSLKNELIIEMYKPLIQNFNFFKDVDNSDFVIKVSTSLKSLISFKGDVLIQEGDLVKEIIFIKNGVIGLNICIDLDNPMNSIKKYMGKNDIGKFDISSAKTSILRQRRKTKSLLDTRIESFLINKNYDSDSFIQSEEEKCDNIEDIKIVDFRKNEHFGDALIFLNERCPFIAKVRTKTADLLILRKMEAIEIYSIYPNIWKRINKKSLYNMEQIYLKIKRVVIDVSIRYNIKFDRKSLIKQNKKLFKKEKLKKVRFIEDLNVNKNIKKNQKNIIQSKLKDKLNKNENKEKNIRKGNIKNKNEKNQLIQEKSKNNKDSNDNSKNIINEEEKVNNKSKNISVNNNTTISIVKNNSFIIIHSKNESKNISNKIKSKISIEKNSFSLKGQSLIKLNNSKNSLRTNESNHSNRLRFSESSINITRLTAKINRQIKNEDINFFSNLKSTKEESLQLHSSYENINKISNNKYIKDLLLQFKTRQFIIKECSEKNNKNYSPNDYHHALTQNQDVNLDKKNYEGTDGKTFKYSHSLKKNFTKKQRYIDKLENINVKLKKRSSVSYSSNKKLKKFDSLKKNMKFGNSNIFIQSKIKRKLTKKKLKKVNIKLKAISENIESANNAINNPNEFYMNLFNNIMNKKSSEGINENNQKIK